jgi:hypothetical protein
MNEKSIAETEAQKELVQKLRIEASVKPMNVSEALKILINDITINQEHDCLVSGFKTQKDNPFKEKSACELI